MSQVIAPVYVASLLAAFFWGVTPVVSKRGFSFGGGPVLMAWLSVAVGAGVFWVSLLVLKGPRLLQFDITPYGVGVFVLAGLVGTVLGRIVMFVGIDEVGASINTAITSTHPFFSTILALLLLGEAVTVLEAAGMLIIVAGVGTVSFSKGGDIGGWSRSDLAFSLLSAVAFGAGTVLRRHGLNVSLVTPLEGAAINILGALLGFTGYVVLAGRRDIFAASRRSYLYFLATGVLSAFALLFLFVGLDIGRVAIVAPLVGTSPLVATGLSYVFLGDLERVTRGVVVGAVLVVAGIALITGG